MRCLQVHSVTTPPWRLAGHASEVGECAVRLLRHRGDHVGIHRSRRCIEESLSEFVSLPVQALAIVRVRTCELEKLVGVDLVMGDRRHRGGREPGCGSVGRNCGAPTVSSLVVSCLAWVWIGDVMALFISRRALARRIERNLPGEDPRRLRSRATRSGRHRPLLHLFDFVWVLFFFRFLTSVTNGWTCHRRPLACAAPPLAAS